MNHIPLSDYEHMPICWFTAFEISRRCRHVLLTAAPPRHIVEEEPGGRLDENDLSIGKNRHSRVLRSLVEGNLKQKNILGISRKYQYVSMSVNLHMFCRLVR